MVGPGSPKLIASRFLVGSARTEGDGCTPAGLRGRQALRDELPGPLLQMFGHLFVHARFVVRASAEAEDAGEGPAQAPEGGHGVWTASTRLMAPDARAHARSSSSRWRRPAAVSS